MSNIALTWALGQRTGSPTRKLVLLKLADQANDNGYCWPSKQTIASHCEVTARTVQRTISQLEEDGYISIARRRDGALNLSNVYQLNLDRVETECPQGGNGVSRVGTEDPQGGDRMSPGVETGCLPIPQEEPSTEPSGNQDGAQARANLSDQIRQVFEYWQERTGHPRTKLDDKRRRKIRARLKDGYTVDDLKVAIDGVLRSPFHMGQNDNNQPYDDIELICRDAPHVDKFIRFAGEQDLSALSKKGRQTVNAAQRWLKRHEG